MNIFTKNLSFVEFNKQVMNWVKFNGQLVYTAFKRLVVKAIPPLTLNNTVGKNLVDYKMWLWLESRIALKGVKYVIFIKSVSVFLSSDCVAPVLRGV